MEGVPGIRGCEDITESHAITLKYRYVAYKIEAVDSLEIAPLPS